MRHASNLPRDVARESEDDSHRLVPDISGGTEHAGTPAVDYSDALLPTVIGSCFRNTPSAGATVHPHVLDAQVSAVAHRPIGNLGSRRDHYRVDATGDRSQVVVAPVSFNLVC